jgi:predicted DNA-binding transcriptional regulator AlpA
MSNLLKEREVAERLSMSVFTLRNWRVAGRGPRWVVLGRRAVRYRPEDLDEYCRQHRAKTNG